MIIDTHQHVFWQGRDDKGLIADMDDHGINLAWLLTWDMPPHEDNRGQHGSLNPIHLRPDGTHAGVPLADLIKARDRYPDRFVLGYCPYPLTGDAPRLFESAYKIHGVRVCGEWKFRVLFDDPRCLELYRAAGALGCPVVLHLDVPYSFNQENKLVYRPEWYGGTVANLERAAKACPQTTFVGHAPGFWREISAGADGARGAYPEGPILPGGRLYGLFEENPNLMADLSANSAIRALKRDPGHAGAFITRFADRLLFGRDFYGKDLHNFLQTLDLPAGVRDKVYFGNARRLLAPQSA